MQTIVFALESYLPKTNTWIYNQLRFLGDIHVLILAGMLNPEHIRFPLNAHTLVSFPGLEVLGTPKLLQRIFRRLVRLILVDSHLDLRIFAWKAKRCDSSLIHAHFSVMGWKFIPVAKILHVPLVVSFYGWDYDLLPNIRPKWRGRYRKLFECGSLFLTEGECGRKQLIEKGVSPARVKVHHLGVDVDAIPFKVRDSKQGEVLRLVQVASFTEKKGHRVLIGAMKLLKDRGAINGVSVTLIGGDSAKSVNNRQQIIDLTRQYHLEKYITFVEHVPYENLHQELLKYHVFVHPSLVTSKGNSEGGAPVVLLDAQATGMPVVSTYHCDIPEEVIDGETGILVPEDDYESLADAILKFLEKPELLTQYGTAGRKHVEKNYSAKRQAEKLAIIYSDLIRNWM